eukprot:m.140568 g.140568  ORF g.140568 m.140568 type:complete len:51 (+) comp15964_c1_seq4:1144-1296(+)
MAPECCRTSQSRTVFQNLQLSCKSDSVCFVFIFFFFLEFLVLIFFLPFGF